MQSHSIICCIFFIIIKGKLILIIVTIRTILQLSNIKFQLRAFELYSQYLTT